MSCDESEKVYCCTTLHSTIETYDSGTGNVTKTRSITPIVCLYVCPDECETVAFDEDLDTQYVTSIVNSLNECSSLEGCEHNYVLLFNSTSCVFTEHIVDNLATAESLTSDTISIVEFIPCLSSFLSSSNNNVFKIKTTKYLDNNTHCHKPCCYLLDNNQSGCIVINPLRCNNQNIQSLFNLNSSLVVLNTTIRDDADSCENHNCFDTNDHINIDNIYSQKCGACCINNNCIKVCDTLYENLDFYEKNVLGTNIGLQNLFAKQYGNIEAANICNALQGVFLGYDTVCSSKMCVHTKIIIT